MAAQTELPRVPVAAGPQRRFVLRTFGGAENKRLCAQLDRATRAN
jgi:hypothetical protein